MDKKCIKIDFDSSFFDEEVRCDYLVSSKSKKIWAIQLDLLSELLRVCKNNKITVSAYAGTILGAIRHNGFIPWDDDIDVCMDRENFKKLMAVCDEFKFPYFLQNAVSDTEFFFGYARLRNSLTTGIVKWEKSPQYNSGIFIDIFVLDGMIDDIELLNKQIADRDKIVKKINLFNWDKANGIKKYGKRLMKELFLRDKTYSYFIDEYEKCLTRYTEVSSKLTLMTHTEKLLKKYWCDKSDLNDLIEVPFENILIPIPKNYDGMLKNMYGDYMQFPSVEKRGKWHEDIIFFDPDLSYKEYYRLNDNEKYGE